MPQNLSRIVMRLARNPGTEFADGDCPPSAPMRQIQGSC